MENANIKPWFELPAETGHIDLFEIDRQARQLRAETMAEAGANMVTWVKTLNVAPLFKTRKAA